MTTIQLTKRYLIIDFSAFFIIFAFRDKCKIPISHKLIILFCPNQVLILIINVFEIESVLTKCINARFKPFDHIIIFVVCVLRTRLSCDIAIHIVVCFSVFFDVVVFIIGVHYNLTCRSFVNYAVFANMIKVRFKNHVAIFVIDNLYFRELRHAIITAEIFCVQLTFCIFSIINRLDKYIGVGFIQRYVIILTVTVILPGVIDIIIHH